MMNELNHLLSPALMRAAGFTLLHSLWQGALVALAASVLLMLLHRHRAEVRYRVVASALTLVVALAALTFVSYYSSGFTALEETSALVTAAAPAAAIKIASTAELAASASPEARWQRLLTAGPAYLERHLPLVVGAWLLGMLAMTLRFLGGLAYVQRLRRYRVAALPPAWQTRLDELVAQAGLSQRVQLLASALVPSPVVLGFFKPVILLPLGAATGLAMGELEMILAHEVAHVLRKDYLFNLLQSVAEIVFFYHPAVWFLSASLRTERENCCDDVATELCGTPRRLAEALSSLAELSYAARAPRLAMAATGPDGRGSLLGRVRRLVTHRPTAPTFLEGFWAACVVLLSAGLLAGSTLASLDASATTPAQAQRLAASTVPTPSGAARPPAAATDSTFVFISPQQKVADLYVDGQHVGQAQPQPYPPTAATGQQEPPSKATRKRAKKQTATATVNSVHTTTNSNSNSSTNDDQEQEQEQDPHARFEAELVKDGLLRNRNEFDYTLKASSFVIDGQAQPAAVADKYRRLYEAETGHKLSPTSSYRNIRTHQEDYVSSTARALAPKPMRKPRPLPAPMPAPMAAPAPMPAPAPAPLPPAPPTAPDNEAITRELKQDGLIAPNAKSYRFELTKDGLVVDGQAQPEAKAAKYRQLLNVPAHQGGGRSSSVRISVEE
jgi:beta-lactamase regulating signal transducer with metallopeptidase domain